MKLFILVSVFVLFPILSVSSFGNEISTSPNTDNQPHFESTSTSEKTKAASQEPPFCTFAHKIEYRCGNDVFSAEGLFGPNAIVKPFQGQYSNVDPCKLKYWKDHIIGINYLPLVEWTSYLNSALSAKVPVKEISAILGAAPTPPDYQLEKNEADDSERPVPSACTLANGEQSQRLKEVFSQFNFKEIPQETMQLLVTYCLAHEITLESWQRLGKALLAAYVLPIGDTNFIIIAHPNMILGAASVSYGDHEIAYTTAGQCAISDDTKECLDRIIKANGRNIAFGFSKGLEKQLKALPFKTHVSSLFVSNRFTDPIRVKMMISKEGDYSFYLNDSGTKPHQLRVGFEEGKLTLYSQETTCGFNHVDGKKLVLQPIAFPDRVSKLANYLKVFSPSDFPAPRGLTDTGIEKGCNLVANYSHWASQTANLAHILANEGASFPDIFKTISRSRVDAKFKSKDKGLPRLRDNLTYGLWRNAEEETVPDEGDPRETQAIRFAESMSQDTATKGILYRPIGVATFDKPDEKARTTEVWFYRKGISVESKKIGRDKKRILITHLRNPLPVFEKYVIQELYTLVSTCRPFEEQKERFISVFYTLLNTAPLQQGDEIVSKVFIASIYESFFGKQLGDPKELKDVYYDALTMTFEDFFERYHPLL